jgi:hypothetical protein
MAFILFGNLTLDVTKDFGIRDITRRHSVPSGANRFREAMICAQYAIVPLADSTRAALENVIVCIEGKFVPTQFWGFNNNPKHLFSVKSNSSSYVGSARAALFLPPVLRDVGTRLRRLQGGAVVGAPAGELRFGLVEHPTEGRVYRVELDEIGRFPMFELAGTRYTGIGVRHSYRTSIHSLWSNGRDRCRCSY